MNIIIKFINSLHKFFKGSAEDAEPAVKVSVSGECQIQPLNRTSESDPLIVIAANGSTSAKEPDITSEASDFVTEKETDILSAPEVQITVSASSGSLEVSSKPALTPSEKASPAPRSVISVFLNQKSPREVQPLSGVKKPVEVEETANTATVTVFFPGEDENQRVFFAPSISENGLHNPPIGNAGLRMLTPFYDSRGILWSGFQCPLIVDPDMPLIGRLPSSVEALGFPQTSFQVPLVGDFSAPQIDGIGNPLPGELYIPHDGWQPPILDELGIPWIKYLHHIEGDDAMQYGSQDNPLLRRIFRSPVTLHTNPGSIPIICYRTIPFYIPVPTSATSIQHCAVPGNPSVDGSSKPQPDAPDNSTNDDDIEEPQNGVTTANSSPTENLVMPKIMGERIPEELAKKLAKVNLLFKIPGEKAYYVNPMLAAFLHVDSIESLKMLYESNDETTLLCLEAAKYFKPDKNGELNFIGDGKLSMLEALLSRHSLKYASRAESLVEETYGKGAVLESIECDESDENGKKHDVIKLRYHTTSARCPCCGKITTSKIKSSGTSRRKAQDIPIHITRPLIVEFRGLRQYICTNPDCSLYKKAFVEQPDCLRANQQRTNRLDALLLVCVIDSSFHGCERALEFFGIKVGDDSIRRIVKGLNYPDDPEIEAIGVDDVADRKGVSYFTVIYALKDHRLLTILEGRDGVELEKWLEGHTSVNLICRDRASAYATHIDSWALRHNISVRQVADRFHLIQNFISHLRDICYSYLPKRIAFDKQTGEILASVPNKIAQAVTPKSTEEALKELDKDYNAAAIEGREKPADFTLSSPSYEDEDVENTDGSPDTSETAAGEPKACKRKKRKSGKQTAREKEAQDKRDKHYERVCNIRKEYDPSGKPNDQIEALAAKYDVCAQTVRKYLKMSQEEVEALKTPKHTNTGPRSKEIDFYKDVIYLMFEDGHNTDEIFWYIKWRGYGKSDSNLIDYILQIHKIVFPKRIQPHKSQYIKLVYPDNVEVLTRSGILKYLVTVNPKTPKNQYLTDHEQAFLEKYPKAKMIRDAFISFHGVIMGNSVDALEKLCNEPPLLPELESFFEQLKRDKEAVSNAIRYSYSSGFVEGNNQRYKTIKKCSYGRLRLAMLIKKCMLAFTSTLENFELGMIVKWIPLRENTEYTKCVLDDYLDGLPA